MRRREFIAALGGAAAWPLMARAQQSMKIPKVGVLWHAGNEEEEAVFLIPFRQELKKLGWSEGQLILENRYAGERYERYQGYATELVSRNVDVLVATTADGAVAAQHATTTIPIVFVIVGDPVRLKLVDSLAHPGGNITGPSTLLIDIVAKRLEVFREAVPGLSNVALLIDRNVTPTGVVEFFRAAAEKLGLTTQLAEVANPDALESIFSSLSSTDVNGVFVSGSSMLFNERKRVGDLAVAHHLPTTVFDSEMVRAGGLMFYGSSFVTTFRRAAHYVDKILRGAKPADLPVEQPTIFELAVNLKTAAALNLAISPMLLARADEVIE
jgi:putative tryptophan/tyrosine transport system substrate-binding protein